MFLLKINCAAIGNVTSTVFIAVSLILTVFYNFKESIMVVYFKVDFSDCSIVCVTHSAWLCLRFRYGIVTYETATFESLYLNKVFVFFCSYLVITR